MPKKILLFKIGAIGDVLMTTPLVRALRRAFPKAVIDYWLGLGSAGALVRNPFLSQSVYFDEKMFFKRDLIGILRLIWRIRKEKYDVAFVLDKSWMIGVVLALTGIPVRVGFDRHGEGFFHTVKVSYGHIRHEIEYYLDLVRVLNIKPDGTKLDLVFAKSRAYDEPNDLPSAKRYYVKSPNTICLVPGGAKNAGQDTPQRRWPIEKWKELTDKLLERGYDIVLVGGISDLYVHDFIPTSERVVSAIAKPSLSGSGAIMKLCKVVVCQDSGPMHVASAVGAKTIVLFGSTNPKRKAPLRNCTVIWKDEDKYDDYYEVYGKERRKNVKFMEDISVEDVLACIS